MKKLKKSLSLLLALVMVLSCMSMSTFATGDGNWIDSANTDWYNESESTFTITSAEQLAGLAKLVNEGNRFSGKTINLGNDINLSGKNWTPIGYGSIHPDDGDSKPSDTTLYYTLKETSKPFTGSFDGKEYTISGLNVTVSEAEKSAGLFGAVANGAQISNVTIDGATVIGNEYVGAVTGIQYSANIIGCHVKGDINISGQHYVGGIVGYSSSKGSAAAMEITGCTVNGSGGTIAATSGDDGSTGDDVGGITGYIWKGNNGAVTVRNCTVQNVTIAAERQGGGIAGMANGGVEVTDCEVTDVEVLCTTTEDVWNYQEVTATATSYKNRAKIAFGGIVGVFCNTGSEASSNTVTRVNLTVADNAYSSAVDAARMGYISGGGYKASSFILDGKATGSGNTVVDSTKALGTADYTGTDNVINGNASDVAKIVSGETDKAVSNSLQAAINAAQNGDTVKLLDNITENSVTISGKILTLDLNGKNITPTTSYVLTVNGGAHLTIQDGGNHPNTPTSNAIKGTKSGLYVEDDGTSVDIYAGYFYGPLGNVGAIVAYPGTNVTIYDCVSQGEAAQPGKKEGKVFYSGSGKNDRHYFGGKITVYGGTFNGRMSTSDWGVYEIRGGTFDRDQVQKYINPVDENGNPTGTSTDQNTTFSMADANYLAPGYKVVEQSSGNYVVSPKITTVNNTSAVNTDNATVATAVNEIIAAASKDAVMNASGSEATLPLTVQVTEVKTDTSNSDKVASVTYEITPADSNSVLSGTYTVTLPVPTALAASGDVWVKHANETAVVRPITNGVVTIDVTSFSPFYVFATNPNASTFTPVKQDVSDAGAITAIYSPVLTLGSNIHYKMLVHFSDATLALLDTKDDDTYVSFMFDGSEKKLKLSDLTVNNAQWFEYSQEVVARKMDSEIVIAVVVNGIKDTSVLQYININAPAAGSGYYTTSGGSVTTSVSTVLSDMKTTYSADSVQYRLADAMINYGEAAKAYFAAENG